MSNLVDLMVEFNCNEREAEVVKKYRELGTPAQAIPGHSTPIHRLTMD